MRMDAQTTPSSGLEKIGTWAAVMETVKVGMREFRDELAINLHASECFGDNA